MKTWKLAVVAMLAVASSSFGAVSLSVTPENAVIDATGLFSVDISYTRDVNSGLIAMSIFPFPDADGEVQLVGIEASGVGLGKWSGANAGRFDPAISPDGLPMADPDFGVPVDMLKTGTDIGATPFSVSGGNQTAAINTAGTTAYGRFWFKTMGGTAPWHLIFNGSWTQKTTGGDFVVGGTFPDTLVTITPEPASMLLVAAGAAFFARRRRVA